MPVAVTPVAPEAPINPRLTAAEMAEYTRPRAMLSADLVIRLIGGMLLSHGGKWQGSTAELYERLVEELGGPTTLGANAATFGRRFIALQRDLAAAGVDCARTRGKVDGLDRRRWVLVARDCNRDRHEEFEAFADEMLVTDEGAETEAGEIYDAYGRWVRRRIRDGIVDGDREAPRLIPPGPFLRMLRNHAARAGANASSIARGVTVYKGLRLKRLPPTPGEIGGFSVSKAGTTMEFAASAAKVVVADGSPPMDGPTHMGIDVGREAPREDANPARIPVMPLFTAASPGGVPRAGDASAAPGATHVDWEAEIEAAVADERAEAEARRASARRWFFIVAIAALFAAVWFTVG